MTRSLQPVLLEMILWLGRIFGHRPDDVDSLFDVRSSGSWLLLKRLLFDDFLKCYQKSVDLVFLLGSFSTFEEVTFCYFRYFFLLVFIFLVNFTRFRTPCLTFVDVICLAQEVAEVLCIDVGFELPEHFVQRRVVSLDSIVRVNVHIELHPFVVVSHEDQHFVLYLFLLLVLLTLRLLILFQLPQ